MNAIQFIQQYGVDKAREVVEGAPEWASDYCTDCKDYVNYDDSCYDGFSECESCVSVNNLKRLVERIDHFVEANNMVDLETLRDCDTSPNCKKFDERVK